MMMAGEIAVSQVAENIIRPAGLLIHPWQVKPRVPTEATLSSGLLAIVDEGWNQKLRLGETEDKARGAAEQKAWSKWAYRADGLMAQKLKVNKQVGQKCYPGKDML